MLKREGKKLIAEADRLDEEIKRLNATADRLRRAVEAAEQAGTGPI
jgi:hypothetical protein